MKKLFVGLALLSATFTGVTGIATVQAQGMGGGGGGGGAAMRNSAKSRLSRVMRGIGALEQGKKMALNKAQAKQVVAIITPWQRKPHMSEAEAKTVYMKINKVLTTKQKNELDKIAAKNRRFGGERNSGNGDRPRGGGGWGGMGGIGGGGAPDAAQMKQMRARMAAMRGFTQTMNPFYPPSKYAELQKAPERMREGMTRRYASQQKMIAQLRAKAR